LRQVRFKELAHRALTGGREIDRLTVAVEKQLSGIGAQFRSEQQTVNSEFPLGEIHGFAHVFDRDGMVDPQRAEDMRFDQVPNESVTGCAAAG
jgi:hypothetical protein